jgi:hypothetical protein
LIFIFSPLVTVLALPVLVLVVLALAVVVVACLFWVKAIAIEAEISNTLAASRADAAALNFLNTIELSPSNLFVDGALNIMCVIMCVPGNRLNSTIKSRAKLSQCQHD